MVSIAVTPRETTDGGNHIHTSRRGKMTERKFPSQISHRYCVRYVHASVLIVHSCTVCTAEKSAKACTVYRLKVTCTSILSERVACVYKMYMRARRVLHGSVHFITTVLRHTGFAPVCMRVDPNWLVGATALYWMLTAAESAEQWRCENKDGLREAALELYMNCHEFHTRRATSTTQSRLWRSRYNAVSSSQTGLTADL